MLFPQTYDAYRDLVAVDEVVRLKARLEDSDRGKKLIVSELQPFDGEAFASPPSRIVITTDGGALVNGRHEKLKTVLGHFPGRDFVEMHVWDEESQQTIVCKMPERVSGGRNRAARRAHRAVRGRLDQRGGRRTEASRGAQMGS